MTVPNAAQDRVYPLTPPADDRRFTLGLIFAISRVLVEAGFPPITAGGDLVALQQALYGFLYAPQPLTMLDVREVLASDGPVPPSLDPEVVAALRRLTRHFAEHGCLTLLDSRGQETAR